MTTESPITIIGRSVQRRARFAIHVLGLAVWTFALTATSPTAAWGQEASYVYPGSEWELIATPEDVGYSSEVLEKVRKYADALETTGLVVVVGGRVLLQHGDVQELSYLASVRKSILAMLYGKYVEDGTINLNWTLADLEMDDIGGLLPVERQATVEHLITARSGVYHAASNAGDNSADAPERGSQRPGQYYLYNNWDFNAAGAAFELMTGRNIYDALQTDLAEPIGMEDFDREQQRKSGNQERSQNLAYHMWLSTRDMARVGYLMLREGRWEDEQVVPVWWARRIVSVITPVEEMNPPALRYRGFGYGYMWWVWDGERAWAPLEGGYSGRGAYGQYITVLPALDMVIAHKTAVPPARQTPWDEYFGIIRRLVEARCAGPEAPDYCPRRR
ncbi:MAG: serine hydrolase [Gemmatimonadales bacterium]|jgi:CubicO group peptidase (beta-lactamase class C family)